VQVASGIEMMKSRVTPLLVAQSVKYKLHVLAHATNTSAIADIIDQKAKELSAHSITMAHHQKTVVQVR
jgi:hypothetical protein